MKTCGIFCSFSGFAIVVAEVISHKWNVLYFQDFSEMSYLKVKNEMKNIVQKYKISYSWFTNNNLDLKRLDYRRVTKVDLDISQEIINLISLVNDKEISFGENCEKLKDEILKYNREIENRAVGALMLAIHQEPRDTSAWLFNHH